MSSNKDDGMRGAGLRGWINGLAASGVAGLVLACFALVCTTGGLAQAGQVQNQLVSSGTLGDNRNASNSAVGLSSADGRYVVFMSEAPTFVEGIADVNNARDVFLYDRVAQTTVLVSRSANSATTTANAWSLGIAISADGEWVLFESVATNLLAGVRDATPWRDVFLYQRSTGEVSLVSRRAGSATTTADFESFGKAISADGEWVLFGSRASNLVAGVNESSFSPDVFLFQRSTGIVTLISRSASAANAVANSESFATALSPDGEWVLFESRAADLVPGVIDTSQLQDVFLYRRSTGAMTLVSRSASSVATAANGSSSATALSSGGEWVLFESEATDLVAGANDTAAITRDVFLYQRSTGDVTLVSRSASSAITAIGSSSAAGMSADGEWVLFESSAGNPVAGGIDGNGGWEDVFLYQRSTGTVSVVSRRAGFPATTANRDSYATAISADGEWVLFGSSASNLVAGVIEGNGWPDVFLFRRSTGTVTLVSRSASSATTTANRDSYAAAISADGEWVLFQSGATNLVAGAIDANGYLPDVFLSQHSTGAVTLVSREDTSATPTANRGSSTTAISADGEWVLFESRASNVVPGVTDTNDEEDVFLGQRSTGAVTLVSRSLDSATTTASRASRAKAVSADGEWVLFEADGSNLMAGIVEGNGSTDVFLFRRSTGALTLVSRSASSASTTANNASFANAISPDGEWVLFESRATNLVSGVVDTNEARDVFLFRRSTGAVTLVSHSAGSETTTANGESAATAISADGESVLLSSRATNLAEGVSDNNQQKDVYVFRRSTGKVTLVSRSANSATTTPNGISFPKGISADGEWVLFDSNATSLVAGVNDEGWRDVFLYQQSTGAVSLVSRSADSPATTANGDSFGSAISADGAWVLFESIAKDVVSGVTDTGFRRDAFLLHRSTGKVTLLSRSASAPNTTANNHSYATAISPNGDWALLASEATDLVPGLADDNEASDVFWYQRDTEELRLVSRSVGSASTTSNGGSSEGKISADGRRVAYNSAALNLVSGVLDVNREADAFLASITSGEAASATITVAGPDPSLVGSVVTIDVAVMGASSRPADGQVVVASSTGETCIDASPSVGGGTSALFSCTITFSTGGVRTLSAVFSGSATHSGRTSAPEPHTVIAPLTVSPATLPGGRAGSAYAQTVSASGLGSVAPYTFRVSAGALPNGLALDGNTGQISGTPDRAGTFVFTITATDASPPGPAGPVTGSRSYAVQILPSVSGIPTPVLRPDRVTVPENGEEVEIDVLANDSIEASLLSVGVLSIIDAPSRGAASVVVRGATGLVDDVIAYTPARHTSGTDTVRYRVCFGGLIPCVDGMVSIQVGPLDVSAIDLNVPGDRGHFDLQVTGLRALPGARFDAHGLMAPVEVVSSLATDLTPETPFDAGGASTTTRTFAAGPSAREWRMIVHARSLSGGDVDLYLGLDANNNGQADSNEVACVAAMSAVSERCELAVSQAANASARYWVRLHSRSGAQEVVAELFEVPLDRPASLRQLAATGPGAVAAISDFPIRLVWNDPTLVPGQVRGGWIEVKSDANTSLGWVPVRIERGAGAAVPFALQSGIDHAMALAGSAANEGLYIDVPPGMTRLDATTTSATNVDLHLARIDTPAASSATPSVPNAPARNLATASAVTPTGNESLTVNNPAAGRWYVTPVNATGTTADLTVRATLIGSGPQLRPGGFFNPERSGNGLFLYPAGNQWAGLWYTYLQDGTTTWYYLQGAEPGSTGFWRGIIYRSAWNGSSNFLTPVGEATVTPRSTSAFTFSYTLDGETGSEAYENFGGGCPTFAGAPLNASGHWFDPARAGSGYSVQLFPNYEFYTVFGYDAQGVPRYLIAERSGIGAATETLTLAQNTGACPLCTRTGNPVRNTVGTLTRTVGSGTLQRIQLTGSYTAGVPGTWAANDSVTPLGGLQGCAGN